MALTMTPSAAAATRAVPVDKAGVGAAVLNASRQAGGAIGIALMGAIMAHEAGGRLTPEAFMAGFQRALEVSAGIAVVGAIVARARPPARAGGRHRAGSGRASRLSTSPGPSHVDDADETPPAAAPGAFSVRGDPFSGSTGRRIVALRPSHALPGARRDPAEVPARDLASDRLRCGPDYRSRVRKSQVARSSDFLYRYLTVRGGAPPRSGERGRSGRQVHSDGHERDRHDLDLGKPDAAARLGERVRALRVGAGLTQSELAEGRYSKEYISQIERGKTRPTDATVACSRSA